MPLLPNKATKNTTSPNRKLRNQAEAQMQEAIKNQAWENSTKEIQRRIKKREKKEAEITKRKNELKDILKKGSSSILPQNYQSREKVLGRRPTMSSPHLTYSLSNNFNRLRLGEEISKTIDEALALLSDDEIADKLSTRPGQTAFEEKRLRELKQSHPELKLTEIKKIIRKEWQKVHDERTYNKQSIYQFL